MTYDEMLVKIHRVVQHGAPSVKYIAIKTGLLPDQVTAAIAYLREHSLEYRWICAHVSRRKGNANKFFATLLDKEGRMIATKPGQIMSLLDGIIETTKTHLSQCRHQAIAKRAQADNYHGDPVLKHMLRDSALDDEQRVVKNEYLLNYLEEVRAAC